MTCQLKLRKIFLTNYRLPTFIKETWLVMNLVTLCIIEYYISIDSIDLLRLFRCLRSLISEWQFSTSGMAALVLKPTTSEQLFYDILLIITRKFTFDAFNKIWLEVFSSDISSGSMRILSGNHLKLRHLRINCKIERSRYLC